MPASVVDRTEFSASSNYLPLKFPFGMSVSEIDCALCCREQLSGWCGAIEVRPGWRPAAPVSSPEGSPYRDRTQRKLAQSPPAGLGVRFDHRHTGRSQTGFCVKLTW